MFINPGEFQKQTVYLMTVEMENEFWKYMYENNEDLEKNFDLTYELKSKHLAFHFSEFRPISESEFIIEELSQIPFKKYELINPIADGTGPILFNKEYGILGIGNVMGPNLVCLPKAANEKIAISIREKLFE